jgi:hypothetical protein
MLILGSFVDVRFRYYKPDCLQERYARQFLYLSCMTYNVVWKAKRAGKHSELR